MEAEVLDGAGAGAVEETAVEEAAEGDAEDAFLPAQPATIAAASSATRPAPAADPYLLRGITAGSVLIRAFPVKETWPSAAGSLLQEFRLSKAFP